MTVSLSARLCVCDTHTAHVFHFKTLTCMLTPCVVCGIAVVDFALCMLSRHLRQESISAPSKPFYLIAPPHVVCMQHILSTHSRYPA